MDANIQATLIGVTAGAAGYWIVTFWMQPIVRYRAIKHKILVDFVYFAQVINPDGMNEDIEKLYRERVLANRASSAELRAIIGELPWWYLKCVKLRGRNPKEAARCLMGYSNNRDYDEADKRDVLIRKLLGLPPKDDD